MRDNTLVYPMAAMVALTAAVLIRLFRGRVAGVRAGAVSASYFKTFQGGAEPEQSLAAARNLSNLFEAPTLFYAGCLAAMLVGDTSSTTSMLAWPYVATRIVHTSIHLGRNRLRGRIRAYFAGWIVLVALWLHLVVDVARAGAATG